jgi:hypothetical protein
VDRPCPVLGTLKVAVLREQDTETEESTRVCYLLNLTALGPPDGPSP